MTGVQTCALPIFHDSFGTHAADMPDMQACLREAFVDIYSVDRLKEFSDFSREVLSAMGQAAELSFQESDETPLTAAEDLFQLLTRWAADVRAEERSVAPPPQETNGVDIDAESDPVIVKPKRGRPKGAATGAKAKKKSAVELPDFQRVDKDFDVKLVRDADYFFF